MVAGVRVIDAQVSGYADAWRWVRFGTVSGLPSDRVRDVVDAADGTAWANTASGLAWYDGYSWTSMGPSRGLPDTSEASSLAPSGAHGMLAVLGRRLYRGDTAGFRPIPIARAGVPLEIQSAVELEGGELLIAADDGALWRFAAGRLAPEALASNAPTASVQALTRTSGGAVWVAGRDGLFRRSGARWIWMADLTPDRLKVGEDSRGRWMVSIFSPQSQRGLWMGQAGRAPSRSRAEGDAVANDAAPDGETAIVNSASELRWRAAGGTEWQDLWVPLQSGSILSLRFRRNGDLWVGSTQGLYLFRRSLRLWTDLARNRADGGNAVNEILRARDGSIWMATANGVEVRPIDGPTRSITRIGASRLGVVTGLAEDDAGAVWISSGSSFEGAWRWDGDTWRHFGSSDGLDAPLVHKIRRDRGGRLWFLGLSAPWATPEGAVREPGAFVYDHRRFTRWGVPEGLPSGRVYAFGETSDGALWFGTGRGLSRWKAGTWTHWRNRERVFSLAVGPDNRVWFADQLNGLSFVDSLDRLHDVGTSDGLRSAEVWDLRVDSAGWLWVATRAGLATYHDGAWSWIGPELGLKWPRLWPVLPLADRVYVGSTGGGVSVLSREGARKPAPRVQITSRAQDDGRVSVRWTVRQFWGLPDADFLETRHRLDGGTWSRWSTARQVLVDHPSGGGHRVEVQAKGMLGDVGPSARHEFRVPHAFFLRPPVAAPMGAALLGLMVITGMLVGQKRRRDAALRESEHFFRESQRSAHIGSYRIDFLTGIWKSSEVMDGIFGIDAGYQRNVDGWLDLVHPDDRTMMGQYLQTEVLDGGRDFDREYRVVRKRDGTARWVHGRGAVARDAAGHALSMAGTIQDITERREVEAQLRESEHRLRDITSNIGDWVWEVDAEGVYTYSSAAGREMFGEVIGRKPFDFMREEDGAEARERFATAAASKAPIRDLENWNITRRGEEICLLTNGVPILHADGRLTGYRGVDRDITERKRSQASIRESEERFRAIFKESPLGVAVIDSRTGRFSEVNPRYAEIAGRTVEEMIGLTWMSITHPDDVQPDLDQMTRVNAGEIPGFTMVKRYGRPDGSFVWISMTVARMRMSGDRQTRHLAMIEDITERMRAESELRLESAALAAAANAIVITDASGAIEWVNAAFVGNSGFTAEEAIGRTPGALLRSGAQDAVFYRHMWETISAGKVWHGELVNRRKDGSLFTEDMTITPLLNEQSDITHFIAVKQDITREKLLEEQFLQAQKMEAVGRLAGGIAHDFNNMLTVISGRAELALLQTGIEQPLRVHLLEIEEAAKRSSMLTRQLLAFARRQTITPKVVDLNEAVANSLRMLQRLIGEDIQLIWQPAPNLCTVHIDPTQLEQVLANLCVNARDAIADVGSLTIATAHRRLDAAFCAIHTEVEPGEYVRLTVSDTGCGMTPAVLAQIFDPFFTTKITGQGTGLGLSTVFGAVRQNGGYITVASKPGHGTTFEIYLPRHVGDDALATSPEAVAPLARGHETVLLVEDESVVLALTTEMLQTEGYTVLGTRSPDDALRLAAEHAGSIDLLLTDVVMPEMNGRELAGRLTALYPKLRCILMSGYPADIIGARGVVDEATHFLAKPFSLTGLATTVRRVLDEAKA